MIDNTPTHMRGGASTNSFEISIASADIVIKLVFTPPSYHLPIIIRLDKPINLQPGKHCIIKLTKIALENML